MPGSLKTLPIGATMGEWFRLARLQLEGQKSEVQAPAFKAGRGVGGGFDFAVDGRFRAGVRHAAAAEALISKSCDWNGCLGFACWAFFLRRLLGSFGFPQGAGHF